MHGANISRFFVATLWLAFAAHLLQADPIHDGSDHKEGGVPAIFDYGRYVNEHHKAYTPTETMIKFKLFLSRTMQIFKHNFLFATKNVSHYLRQNQFTDMTEEELQKYQPKGTDTDLKPVAGAELYPDLPATAYVNLKNGRSETESMASLDDLKVEPRHDLKERLSSYLRPLGSEQKIDVKGLIRAIKKNPETAAQMVSIIDIKEGLKATTYTARLDKAGEEHGVEYRPIVEPNNQDYDMTNIKSFGLMGKLFDWDSDDYHNYAESMMRGLDSDDPFGGYRDDYLNDDYIPPLSFASVFNGIKTIFEILTTDPSEDDMYANGKKPDQRPEKKAEEKQVGLEFLIDWRRTGCITPSKTQGSCNSCYAFSTMALMEYFYCTETKKLTDFSPQYIVDCGEKSDLHGCVSGKVSRVGDFIKTYGIELNTLYPYEEKANQCPYDKKNDEERRNGYLRPEIRRWVHLSEIDAWFKWITRSPLVVGINMPSDFLRYGGGIHSGIDCVQDMVHAMLLVGTGIEDGNRFWLLKNSYGEKWGENGYFRLAHSAPLKCFNSAFVIRAKFNTSK